MRNNKIAIIGTVGLPAKYGGFETLAEYLTKYLFDDYNLTVYCSSYSYHEKTSSYNGAVLKYINLKANGVQSIPYDIVSIIQASRSMDTLLILGVSGCVILPLIKKFRSKKIIVNIDGLEWKRQKWNKYAKWFLKFSEKQAVNYADVVITDNKAIQKYVQKEYGVISKLIAYGADHAMRVSIDTTLLEEYPFLSNNYCFTVCRVEPENNLHIIIEAMAQQNTMFLVIVGNWAVSQYGKGLRKQYANVEHIHLLDPIYDQNKLNQIRSNCTLYLHGHSAGGTNPSLVEAMYLKLPIFAFDVSYNKETTEYKAKYFSSVEELVDLIDGLEQSSLNDLAKKTFEIAARRYLWHKITNDYAQLF